MYVKFVYQGHRVKFNVTGARKCVRVCCSWVVCTGMKDYRVLIIVFSARRSYASAVLGVVTLSVCLSICPSVTRMLYNKTKQCNVDILIPHERVGLINRFLTPTAVGRRHHLSSENCAQSDPRPWKNAEFDRLPLITSQQ